MLRRSAWAALQRPSAAWRTPNAAAAAAAAAAANPRRAFADGAYVGSKKLLQLLEIEADDALTVPRAKVKSQYLQLAKLHHPDVGEQPSAQRFAAVTDAYKQLLERLPDEPVKAAPGGKEEVLGANGRKKLVKHKGRPLKKSARGGQQVKMMQMVLMVLLLALLVVLLLLLLLLLLMLTLFHPQAGIFGSAGAIDSINETFNPEGGGGMKVKNR